MSSSINPQNNRDLNQGFLNIWSKFGGPILNEWWVIARTSAKWGNFDVEGKFDLEGKGQSPQQNNKDLNQGLLHPWFNLVILAWTGLELSRGQASDWHTDGQTDAGNNSRWPYRPRVKRYQIFLKRHFNTAFLLSKFYSKSCFMPTTAGTSMGLSHFKAFKQFLIQTSRLWDFKKSYNTTAYRIFKQTGPDAIEQVTAGAYVKYGP